MYPLQYIHLSNSVYVPIAVHHPVIVCVYPLQYITQ